MLNWDRSHDYVLHRYWIDLTRVTIRFAEAPPSVGELAALRRCVPHFQDMPPMQVRAVIGCSMELPLGEMATREALLLIEAARSQGLETVAESASYVTYLPYDRTAGCAWLIEDEIKAAAVVQDMIAAGIQIEEVEG